MEQEVIYATAHGKKVLEKRLEELISKREEVAHKICEARELGDLKENAEYAAAREEQSNLEDEIAGIHEKLPILKMFSYSKVDTSCVNIGARVQIEDVSTKKKQEWTITGVIENDPENSYISNEAPLGKLLLGKKVGDIVEIFTPIGKNRYKIVKISAGA
jgi:transcription elongation factor GreA